MKAVVEEIKPLVEKVFAHLHSHPEISWQEVETTTYLKELLEAEGIQVETFDDSTGLVAVVGDGEPCVGLRTDIDALWQEVDGEYKANHSCGHDAHMTLAVGTLLVLKKLGIPKKGRLKVIFQPAEEKGTGALSFVEKGIVDDIDYLYGVHLRPNQEVADGYATPAIMHGSAKMLSGKIIGTDAHGARPHEGQNAIEVMALLVQAIHSIHVDPMVPHTAKLTMFQAGGESANIIPGTATFSIDVRAQTNKVMDKLFQQVTKAIESVANLSGVQIPIEIKAEIAAAEVDDTAVELMARAIEETLGKEFLVPPVVTPGGEDFHFYTLKRPSVKASMLGLGCGLAPGLHHPKMTFNQESLINGIEILARTVQHTFEQLDQRK
ncbi:M20 peptidase aminoacylase family protein [Planococcus sp. N028]|uniref:M20 peptidase aminoacylase family protein n=1 Tax=Planococcus shixiaomingii TaxID=3058393 RepID=A0ABT8N4K5_9BACL|nr:MULTISPECIES: M20 peptidase aminoacylase family protein [unclassified Planococcus (in: firmicutes)]MDN7242818.1 M20 peptidase aminoacylase family protein [Planococcus sp. N028]WKA55558.1 M20 peptidase aminoacylase family protein [Planococcus sp. N022]